MIDLRLEMKKLLTDTYDWIIVRVMSGEKCNCWRDESHTPDPSCKRCDGSGWLYKEFIHKSKNFLVDSRVVAHTQDFDYGKSYSNALTSWMDYNEKTVNIKKNDMIFTVAVTSNGKISKPIKRLQKWLITDTFPYCLDGGKPEFVKALAKPLNF